LLGQPSPAHPACSGYSLDWQSSAGLLGRALREARPLSSFDRSSGETEALVDEQLRRLLKAPGLLVLPLIAGDVPLGVAVAGIPSPRRLPLDEWRTGLNLFAGQLALLLLQVREAEAARETEESAGRQQRNLEVRKLLHEVNNPLAVITNYLHVLGLKLGEDGPVKELAVLREELARVGDLLARFKDLEQPPAPGEERLELNRTIADLCTIFADGLFQGKKIRAELDLDESIPALALSPGALRQVVMNLVKNAAEALPKGGRIDLATRDRIHKNGALFVELRIGDNGPGLPEHVLNELFTPVTSTKPGHAGLGLSIVKQLLDQLGAEISCASGPTTGTRFQILLPRTLPREASAHA
jgi:nitrogen-specific signal transduction histidine kinase